MFEWFMSFWNNTNYKIKPKRIRNPKTIKEKICVILKSDKYGFVKIISDF